ncbi:BZ3500_MvSof-1268-A1-R1_Chr9g10732 [Microbotryum saponariae]|uniref:BZ3500_MvSof-1268-A1-R1_Chr9g10732 protein n=1 Tax=Microbotryum saponariae TaxID=289078 RepID=A0A2X0L216_9BASI|nr:BZ3501_MvSof-1269-A2-R1_Chr9g10480 [Microbotryum saponariae]SDA00601.1 BZ3500_MvSof-1268-A1-R1_Chr9g10732 [Microbotryum saponariae]
MKARRQQGDGNFVLLVNEEVRLVVSLESKRDESVLDGYVEEHVTTKGDLASRMFRFAQTAAVKLDATLPETCHTSGILIKVVTFSFFWRPFALAYHHASASIGAGFDRYPPSNYYEQAHGTETRFSTMICGAYNGFVAERREHRASVADALAHCSNIPTDTCASPVNRPNMPTDGDFGVLYSVVSQSIRDTKFEPAIRSPSLKDRTTRFSN